MAQKKKGLSAKSAQKAKKKAKPVEPEDDDEDDDEEEDEKPKKGKKLAAPIKKKGGVDWEAMLESLEAGGANGNILFPKSGKTRIKLVLEDDDDEASWYTEAVGEFNGKVRTRYILRAAVLFPAQDEKKLMGVVVAKTAMKAIVGMLAEKYDLTDPEEGHGITLSKTGEGLNTTWGATPSPKPIEIEDFDEYSEDGAGLEELVTALEDIAAKNVAKSKGGKKGKGKDEDEDDDEEDDW